MTTETRAQLRERLEKLDAERTQGDWQAADWGDDYGDDTTVVETSRDEILQPGQSSIWPDGKQKIKVAEAELVSDAAFIASAPLMMQYIRDLEARLKIAEDGLEAVAMHQKIVGGGMGAMTGAYAIAQQAISRIRADGWVEEK